MIGKQIKGNSFRGILKYMEAKEKEGIGHFLDSNMISKTARELSSEFGIIRSKNPDLKKAVYHCALAIRKPESLSDEQFTELGQEYLGKMGFGNSQYVMYRHHDRNHPHIHIIANRIDMEGIVVSDKWDYKRSEKIIRELEKKYELTPVLSSAQSKESSLSKGQIELYRRTGTIPAKKQIQIILRDTLNKAKSIHDFEKNLAEYGILIQYHKNNQEKIFGISFELNGQPFKGSALGKAYSWKNINNQIHLNNERNRGNGQEIERTKAANTREPGREPSEKQHRQYSGIERGTNADNGKLSKTNNGPATGISKPPGTANKSYHGDSNDGTAKSFPGQENIEFEKNEPFSEHQGNGIGHNDWVDVGARNLSNPVLSSGSLKDEDEELPKKKKKKKRRGKNPGIGI
jgi:hypothetical protein